MICSLNNLNDISLILWYNNFSIKDLIFIKYRFLTFETIPFKNAHEVITTDVQLFEGGASKLVPYVAQGYVQNVMQL